MTKIIERREEFDQLSAELDAELDKARVWAHGITTRVTSQH